jgi:hypothetical protein
MRVPHLGQHCLRSNSRSRRPGLRAELLAEYPRIHRRGEGGSIHSLSGPNSSALGRAAATLMEYPKRLMGARMEDALGKHLVRKARKEVGTSSAKRERPCVSLRRRSSVIGTFQQTDRKEFRYRYATIGRFHRNEDLREEGGHLCRRSRPSSCRYDRYTRWKSSHARRQRASPQAISVARPSPIG